MKAELIFLTIRYIGRLWWAL